jgi:hypothetical protein
MPRKVVSPIDELLADTQQLVARLLRENRGLKLRNVKLTSELERVSKGWEQIKALARQAPRKVKSPPR